MDLLDYVEMESLDEDQKKIAELVGMEGFRNLVLDLWRHCHLYPQGGEPGEDRAGPADTGGV